MSPAEYLEILNQYADGVSSEGTAVLSILFAYIAATYFVGEQLSRFQAWSLSVLYSTFILMPASGIVRRVMNIQFLQEKFQQDYPELSQTVIATAVPNFHIVVGCLLSAVWLFSLYFMIHTRSTVS